MACFYRYICCCFFVFQLLDYKYTTNYRNFWPALKALEAELHCINEWEVKAKNLNFSALININVEHFTREMNAMTKVLKYYKSLN